MNNTLSPGVIAIVLLAYFALLIIISFLTSRNANSDSFFTGNKQSPWYLVAFGMIGASLSGVTFISVPGKVASEGMAYFQIVLGYVIGYIVIAQVLMPLYYRLNVTSIYQYLQTRFGLVSYKTGASFFILSRTLGSATRLYLATEVLHLFLFKDLGVPYWLTGFDMGLYIQRRNKNNCLHRYVSNCFSNQCRNHLYDCYIQCTRTELE
jgi:Na+/proline symporter